MHYVYSTLILRSLGPQRRLVYYVHVCNYAYI